MTAPPRSARLTRPPFVGDPISRPSEVVGPPAGDTEKAEEPRFSLSATQTMASVAAAVTAALVGSKLGVAGTVIGAGLASVISVVGGAVFGHSILFTRKQVKRAVLQVRGPDPTDDAATEMMTTVLPARAIADQRTVVIPAVTRDDLKRAKRAEPRGSRPTRRKLGGRLLVAVAAATAVFLSSLAAVTLVEAVKGSPLSGGGNGGLSVLGGNSGTGKSGTVEVPVTTLTEATTEQVTARSTVTQTVTSEKSTTAPATAQPSRPTPTTASSTRATVSTSSAPTVSSGQAAPTSSPGAPSSAVR